MQIYLVSNDKGPDPFDFHLVWSDYNLKYSQKTYIQANYVLVQYKFSLAIKWYPTGINIFEIKRTGIWNQLLVP